MEKLQGIYKRQLPSVVGNGRSVVNFRLDDRRRRHALFGFHHDGDVIGMGKH